MTKIKGRIILDVLYVLNIRKVEGTGVTSAEEISEKGKAAIPLWIYFVAKKVWIRERNIIYEVRHIQMNIGI